MIDFQQLSHFELRQICYFMTIVNTGNNFTETANRLGIKQPPLTKSIQSLEKLLSKGQNPGEVKLFDRSKRPMELTQAGKLFLEEAQQALIHLDRAIIQARRASQGQIGRLQIGINNSIANSILPDVLQKFQSRFPNVELVMHEAPIQQELPMLKARQLDVIFQRSPYLVEDDSNLNIIPILEEYFVAALSQDHPLAQQTQLSLKALAADSIILPPLDILPFYEKVVLLCREAGFEPKILPTAVVTGVVTLLSLVAANVGISILPNHVQTLHREGVVYRPIHDAKLTRQVAVIWRQNDSSVILRNFIDAIQNSLVDAW
jgi:DNA-binding transcriptional LysR family regulator